ncbi:MAG: MerR family transcriptional regulator [Candidatus Gastranaerophilaceae bacterium]|jgi:MerR family transcriptional regulator/heat shock protein HspR
MINFDKKKSEGLSQDKPMFPISIVAELLKIHQRTLRIYDEMDLLSPSRSPKNRRLYSFNNIERGKFIQYLTKDLGINLSGVKIIFHLLNQQGIDYDNYIDHLKKIAKKLNISEQDQQDKREKLSKRGRKANKDKETT